MRDLNGDRVVFREWEGGGGEEGEEEGEGIECVV